MAFCASPAAVISTNENPRGCPSFTVRHDIDAFHVPELGDSAMQVVLDGLIAEISDKNVSHPDSFRAVSGGLR
jgi:hypothetical protein